MAGVGGDGGGDFEAPEAVVVEEKQVNKCDLDLYGHKNGFWFL